MSPGTPDTNPAPPPSVAAGPARPFEAHGAWEAEPKRPLPSWLNATLALWGTAAVTVLLSMLAMGMMWLSYAQERQSEQEQAELFAKNLEWHTNQTLAATELTLRSLARELDGVEGDDKTRPPPKLAAQPPARQQEIRNQLLHQALATRPFVRSFSLLDEQGLVLASSNPANIGASLSLAQLRGSAQPLRSHPDGLGRLQAGRDLHERLDPGRQTEAEQRANANANASAGHSSGQFFVPLSLPISPQADRGYLVATLNPAYFSNVFDSQLGRGGHIAALLSLNGQLIVGSEGLKLTTGSLLNQHLVFKQKLPTQEEGQYKDIGMLGQSSLGSYRLTHNYPWVVIVEVPNSQVWAHVQAELQAVLVAYLGSLGLMLVLGMLAWRALSAYDQAHIELAQMHQSLAAREREQSLLIENVQELMFRTDTQGVLQFINHANFLTSKDGTPVLGSPFEALVDARDHAKVSNLFRSASGFLKLPVALRMLAHKGRQRVLEVSVTPFRDTEGQLAGYVGFAIDVTEREEARARLQAQLEFTARMIDVCPIPLYAKDASLRYVMVNQAWSEITGIDKTIAMGRRFSELKPPSIATPVEERDHWLLGHGGSEHKEIHDNQRTLLTHKTVFTDSHGKIAGVVGSAVDVSRFIEAEEQIREARDAAEQANRIKTEFVANMSHELRAPLQSIIGFSELGQARSGESPRLQTMFQRIFSAGHRMLELVNNLLDLSRLESSVGHLSLLKQDCRPLIEQLLNEYVSLATERKINLQGQLAEQPLMASVDAARLQQVLRNMLDNALRFSPPDGRIELKAACDAQGLRISVRDQGPGIPEAEMESIFAPFVQGSMNQGGAGLGLAICRKIMNAHGGSISAHNHREGGALFELRLPPC
nr:ATP-binding protein [uncultured Roseateles sp.]